MKILFYSDSNSILLKMFLEFHIIFFLRLGVYVSNSTVYLFLFRGPAFTSLGWNWSLSFRDICCCLFFVLVSQ